MNERGFTLMETLVALGILSIVCLTAGLILDTIAKLHQETIELWKQQLGERR